MSFPRPLTIAQILPALESGGVERGTLEVARALVASGHRSLVISTGGRLVPTLQREGSEHITLPVGKKSLTTLTTLPSLRRFLIEQRVDVLHARSRVPAWLAWLTCKSLAGSVRPRFVTTVHGFYSVNAFSRIMTRGEAVIAVSESIRDYILTHYPQTPPSSVRLIERGRDEREFPHGYRPSAEWLARWQAEHPHLAGARLLTLPGRLVRLKGHRDFLILIQRLRQLNFNVHGLIVGGTEPGREAYAVELKQASDLMGLREHITFTGHRGDIRDLYAVSDIVFSLSEKPESFGRTTLEALSIGTPVVGYAHGGVGEILGRLFPCGGVTPGNVTELVQCVEQLLNAPPSLVPPFKEYQLSTMQRETISLYESLVFAADRESSTIRRAA